MPTLEDNQRCWGSSYDWRQGGDEWSETWGGSNMQWFGTILPRIHPYLPTGTVLEIGPGFGRWSQFIVNRCDHLILVDLSEKCIAACKERFRDRSHVQYHVNDGKALDCIDDHSIDFVFDFDSLVHAEADVVEAYLIQLGRKLKPGGAGFIHHSNLGEHPRFYSTYSLIARHRWIYSALTRFGLLAGPHWRAPSMTSTKFREYAERGGLHCISQEKINWGSRRTIDCLSLFIKSKVSKRGSNSVLQNPHFMSKARYLSKLSRIYGSASRTQ